MMDFLDKKFLTWIGKNKLTFFLVILLMGNVYQYMDRKNIQQRYEDYIRQQNDYWRQRAEKLEFLFDSLIQLEKSSDKKPKS